jgi:hypothetical protein
VAVDRNVATTEAAGRLLDANLLGGARLAELAEECKSLIGLCNLVVHAADEFAPQVRDARNKLRRLVGGKGNLGQMAVALMGEARKQLEFAYKIQSETYSLRRVEEFQAVVLRSRRRPRRCSSASWRGCKRSRRSARPRISRPAGRL